MRPGQTGPGHADHQGRRCRAAETTPQTWMRPAPGRAGTRREAELTDSLPRGGQEPLPGLEIGPDLGPFPWPTRAWAVLHRYALSGLPFSAEHVRRAVGDPPAPGQLGALFAAASAQGLIRQVGWVRSGTATRKHGGCALWAGTAKAVAA